MRAQAPVPSPDGRAARRHAAEGVNLLQREDPIRALAAFRAAAREDFDSVEVRVGIGRCHLLLGAPLIALAYAKAAQRAEPGHDGARALEVRALMRGRRFRAALKRSKALVYGDRQPGVETLAAHASALFRMQKNDEAAKIYREVVRLDPLFAEAHLRLGSGLTAPCEVVISSTVRRGVTAARSGALDRAVELYQRALDEAPGDPVVHRLLGEVLFRQIAAESMAECDAAFRWLDSRMPSPELRGLPIEQFMPAFDRLGKRRQRIAARSLALFKGRLSRLVTLGGRHDLISEVERTTDDPSRANLRGRRTFDGRVWDDVRGIGGLRAATGIESLDEAIGYGFDTLAHEIAHQAHLYAFPHRIRVRIRAYYDRALAENRCLDFYAASNDAEYFGQGVEAFACLGKRPGYEVTHGHTRFELLRVDPKLYELIQGLVDYDPLDPKKSNTAQRAELLRAAIAVALRSGRTADAVTAAEMLPRGDERDTLLRSARRALRLSKSY